MQKRPNVYSAPTFRNAALAAMAALTVAACSPSSKNEAQYWDNHQKSLTEQSTAYPAFKTILEAHKAAAEPMMKAAKALSDEDAKAKKMKEANAALTKVLGKMTEIKTKKASLNSLIEKLNKLKLPKDKHERRTDAVNAARASLREVEKAMTGATVTNDEEALKVLDAQVSALISARGAADRAYNAVKPKKAKKRRKKRK